jgi:purine-binding chemotaxis protein CheW
MENTKSDTPEVRQEGQKFLFVSVNGIEYGIEIELVQEIIVMQEISPIPSAKPFLKGVINIRGTIVPVVDLRVKMGLPPYDYDELSCIVVVMAAGEKIGITVEGVQDVLQLEPSQLQESPARLDCGNKCCISTRIANIDGGAKQILDLNKVLDLNQDQGQKQNDKVC